MHPRLLTLHQIPTVKHRRGVTLSIWLLQYFLFIIINKSSINSFFFSNSNGYCNNNN